MSPLHFRENGANKRVGVKKPVDLNSTGFFFALLGVHAKGAAVASSNLLLTEFALTRFCVGVSF
ncbi:MAG: hypothetical protein COS84_07720 [Armatimonadetes bacterium CG07_land_8_20_14_0_80_40_9]|nr:MAG: hypothetical protein COS84_07720 [Armatimonadetes bacterium CG07_land_8_20_14_0_80_40_9]